MTLRFACLITTALTLFGVINYAPARIDAANIVGFFPSPSKSHVIIHSAVANALAEAGHNVTVVGVLPNINKRAKYNYIQIDGHTHLDYQFTKDMVNKPAPLYQRFNQMLQQLTVMANASMMSPKMQQFLQTHTKSSFDLLILGYFMNDFHFGLAAHFDCPIIVSFMVQPIHFINKLIGNPDEVAYVPTIFSGGKQPLNFFGRVKTFLVSSFEQYILYNFNEYANQKLYNYHFPSDRYPPLNEIKKNISLVFSNHHFSQSPIRPNVPALIEIGGIQIKPKPDPLPKDIAEIVDNAKNGVIYFSFGSNVQGTHLSDEKAKLMFDVLSQLPYTVLWKWGDTDFPGTAANIIYKTWLPQDDILAHPNVKLFITHGGQGSIVESQYHGVPMVGVPLFGDQPSNMINVVESGFGVSLDYVTLTAHDFKTAILEVLQNSKYATAVKTFADLYRDRPMTPQQLVVYWSEYVLRHKGAKHMQSPAVYMNRFQLLSLDVAAFLLAVLSLIIWIFVKLCKLICCRSRGGKAKKSDDKDKRVTKTKKSDDKDKRVTKTKKNK